MSADGPTGLIPAILAGLTLRGTGFLNGRPPRPAANSQRDPDDPGHETSDVNVRNTVLVMAGLALDGAGGRRHDGLADEHLRGEPAAGAPCPDAAADDAA